VAQLGWVLPPKRRATVGRVVHPQLCDAQRFEGGREADARHEPVDHGGVDHQAAEGGQPPQACVEGVEKGQEGSCWKWRAGLVGSTLAEVIKGSAPVGQEASSGFEASIILGGQIKGGDPTLFLIYPEGNFVEVTTETPFFQIGEAKYGKPILVRAYDPDMCFADAAECTANDD